MYIHYCYCPGNIRRHKKGGNLSTYYIIVFRYAKHLCKTYTLYTLSMLMFDLCIPEAKGLITFVFIITLDYFIL
jgi:hypothetical protein